MIRFVALIVLIGIVATPTAAANIYHVGPERDIKRLKTVASKLQPGDTVEIDPGTYREVLKLAVDGTRDAPIIIRGVGKTRSMFDAEGLNVSGRGPIPRAIFQIEGAFIVIEHLEFKNARNGNNGAGIRLNGSTNALIRDCKISYCDMGIQGGDRETATIEACDIGFNGTTEYNGYSHNFYMTGNRVIVRNCHIHDSLYGQNFKSRAHYNELWYNWIVDSNEGEVGPVDGKGETDRPNSNVLMVGNIVVSKPNRTGNKAKYILFGSESGGSHDGTLYLFHNILIAGSPRNIFVQLHDPYARAVIRNNIFYGSNQILAYAQKPISVTGSHNQLPSSANIPREFTDTITGTDPGFTDIDHRDFRLKPDSLFMDQSTPDLEYIDGDGVKHRLAIDQTYLQQIRIQLHLRTGISDYEAYDPEK